MWNESWGGYTGSTPCSDGKFIYFDSTLQERAVGLFHDALCRKGILGLGAKESLRFSAYRSSFSVLAPAERIFQKESE